MTKRFFFARISLVTSVSSYSVTTHERTINNHARSNTPKWSTWIYDNGKPQKQILRMLSLIA